MSKKTANDLACEALVKKYGCLSHFTGIEYFCGDQGLNPESCVSCWRQYFQKKADIPDGWDFVKEIYRYAGNASSANDIYCYIERSLQQAGMEVE